VADSPRIDELRRRVERDPSSIAFAQLAEEHRRIGNFDEAVRVARSGLGRHPGYLSARVTLGRALLELDQYDEAQQELEAVLRVAPENLAAVRALADIHQRRGELGEAARQYTSALAVGRGSFDLPEFPAPGLDLPALDLPESLGSGIDEFNRSLEALDALTLDPMPPVADIQLGGIDAPLDLPSEHPPVPPAIPPDPALAELESWLEAIIRHRAR
jgi:tetratricopeptide (TPR) repeat protein